MQLRGILESALYVNDLGAAREFYHGRLGLEILVDGPPRQLFFRVGVNDVLLVFDADETSNVETHVGGVGIPMHGTRGRGHLCFTMAAAELDQWRERLRALDIEIEAEVAWPRGGHSLYFRDPAGNSLEIASPKIWGLPE